MIYLFLIFTILYLFLAWYRIDWAVLLLIVAFPSYLIRFGIFGIPSTALEIMILIAFFVWLIKQTKFLDFLKGKYTIKDYLRNKKMRAPYPFGWELATLLFIAWVSAIAAGFNNQALGIWKAYFFEPALFFILVLNVFATKPTLTPACRQAGSLSPSFDGVNSKGGNTVPPLSERGGQEGFFQIEKIILALTVSAFAVSLLAIYQKITGNLIDNPMWATAATRRSVSLFGYPNAVGLYLGPIVMVLMGYFFTVILRSAKGRTEEYREQRARLWVLRYAQDDKLKIIFIGLTIVISLLSIYFAKSEGAILGLIAALFIFAILFGSKLRWAVIIGTVIITGALLINQPTRYYIEDKIQLHDLSGQIRRQQWKETHKMLTASVTRFIFGAGLANYQAAIKPYHQEGIFVRDYRNPDWHRQTVISDAFRKKVWQPTEIYLYPHNILLNFWTELGLAGMFLFMWIIGKYFWIIISNFEFRISNQYFIFNKLKFYFSKFIQNSKFKIQNSSDKKNNYLYLGLLGAMIVIIVHGIVDVPYFKNDLAVMFWLLIALVSLVNASSH